MICFGVRGDRGRPATIVLGDKGTDPLRPAWSLGIRGIGEPRGRSTGRGLVGRLGLNNGCTTGRSVTAVWSFIEGCSTEASDFGASRRSGAPDEDVGGMITFGLEGKPLLKIP